MKECLCNRNLILSFFNSLILSLFIGCQPRLQPQAPSKEKSPEQTTSRPELAFISFKITKYSLDKTSISIISITKAEGKTEDLPYLSRGKNILTITLLDKDKNDLTFTITDHPLVKEVEVATENKTFERKAVSLKEAEFFVRLNFKPQTSYIRIEETINGIQKEVATLPYPAQ